MCFFLIFLIFPKPLHSLKMIVFKKKKNWKCNFIGLTLPLTLHLQFSTSQDARSESCTNESLVIEIRLILYTYSVLCFLQINCPYSQKKMLYVQTYEFFLLQILLRLMIMQMPSREATSIFNGIVLNWVAPLFIKYILKFAQMQFHDINLYNNNFKMFGILQVLNLNADKRSEGQK